MMLALPSPRDEAWRWSDLSALAALSAGRPRQRTMNLAPYWLEAGARLVFINGRYWPSRSHPGPITIGSVAADSDHPLGKLCNGDGWTLRIFTSGDPEPLIEVIHLSTGGANHVPAHISLAEGIQARICETYLGDGWANRLTKIRLAPGSSLHRSARLMQGTGFTSLRDVIDVGPGASLTSHVLGLGSAGTRVDAAINLLGRDARADYGGALLGHSDQRQEAVVVAHHLAEGGVSRQPWRAVACDQATVSLAARVEIAKHAQKTDAGQSLRGLLLDRSAKINLKPEMVIYADDVKAAHGATVGELDREALYYLASRGIPPRSARSLLTSSFVAQSLDGIESETVRKSWSAAATAWLEKDG